MKAHRLAGWLTVLTLAGCGAQSVTGDPSVTGNDGGLPVEEASADAAAAPLFPVRLEVGSSVAVVDLSTLPTRTYKGSQVVSLDVVWAVGGLGDAAGLTFDFEGDDGFRSSSRPKCVTPLSGAVLSQGYVLPATRSLVWDETLGYPGCWAVHSLAKIIARSARDASDAGGP